MSSDLPDEIMLKPSWLKWSMLLLISAVFVAGGVLMIGDGEHLTGAFVAGFFGLGLVVPIWQVTSRNTWLRLDADGFEQRALGRTFKERWDNVSEFVAVGLPAGPIQRPTVMYEPHEIKGGRVTHALAGAVRPLTGGPSHAISDTYGMSAEDLAALMNAFRARALERARRRGGVE